MQTLDDNAIHVRYWDACDVPELVGMAERNGAIISRRDLWTQFERQQYCALRSDLHFFLRLVAELDGEIVGTALGHDHVFVPRDWLVVRVQVDGRHRRRGIGSALTSALEAEIAARAPAGLEGRIRAGDTVSRLWAERRGFDQSLSEVALTLDPRDVPMSVLETGRTAPAGIEFACMADPAKAREWSELYELLATLVCELPGMDGAPGPSARTVESSFTGWASVVPEATWVATEGDRWIGVTISGQYGSSGLYTWFTGVDPGWRHRGIATALKRRAVKSAQAMHIRRMVSHVAASNLPMLGLNRSLGYTSDDPVWVMRRPALRLTSR